MMRKGSSFYGDEEERDWTPIVIAAFASLAIHVFLYFRVSDMRFDVTAQVPEKFRDTPTRKIVNFEHVRRDPAKPLEQSPLGDPSARATVGMTSEQLSEIFEVPAVAFEAPPPQRAAVEAANLKEPAAPEPAAAELPAWQPRQEVAAIVDRMVRDDVALLPRHEIFSIERFDAAPDYVPEAPVSAAAPEAAVPESLFAASPAAETESADVPEPPAPESIAERIVTDPAATPAATLTTFGEKPGDISPYRHVDNRLAAAISVYDPPGADSRKYFRIEVVPRENSGLPIARKDIVFVQDASRSLAKERLHFCKEGLKESLGCIAAGDRFNIVSFRDNATFCFGEGWATPSRENFEKAIAFIDSLESRGDTDLFRSLQSLLTLPRDPARPLIVVVVTDGKATTGITTSSRIIGEFSKLNDDMSLYILGTQAKANAYLLDLLSFCNRGSQYIVRSDRWAIPAAIYDLAQSCSKPVLGRVKVDANVASGAEFFPLPSANLYAGEPLVYYGSCPRGTRDMTLQIRGEAGDARLDCLFALDLAAAERGGPEIKEGWARRKMHSLVGDYARNPSGNAKAAMRELNAATGEPIPYLGEF